MFNNLLLFNKMDLKYPIDPNSEIEANQIISEIYNNFIQQYTMFLNSHTFVLNYQDDIFGILSYRLFKSLQGFLNFDFKIVCDCKIKKTAHLINKKDIVSKRKLKKIPIIEFSCFNPLYYVETEYFSFKNLSKERSLIKDLTPATLRIMLKFNNLCDAKNGFLYDYLEEGFAKRFEKNCTRKWLFALDNIPYPLYKTIYFDFKIPEIKVYALEGSETDFVLFDQIIAADNKNDIIFYHCPSEKGIEFIKANLNPYLSYKNKIVDDFNLNIDKEKIDKLIEERNQMIKEERNASFYS